MIARKIKKVFFITVFLLGTLFLAGKSLAANQPVVLFSDMTDGPTTGFDGSGTKGAAVTIWGRNFGSSRGSSYISVGGVNLTNDSDYAEWGATTNPQTASGQQRITFYLNSNMTTGGTAPNTTISVHTSNGASGTIPFHCRALGSNHIYFLSPDGSDSNSGTSKDAPWKSGTKIRTTVNAGDIVYFKSGIYAGPFDANEGWNKNSFLLIYNEANNKNGSAYNTITMTAYPGEVAQIGNGGVSSSDMNSFIFGMASSSYHPQMAYWNIAKLKFLVYSSVVSGGTGANICQFNHVRFVGLDVQSTYSTTGTGIGITFGPSVESKVLGCYFHQMGQGAPAPAPTTSIGFGTGLTGNYKTIVTYGVYANDVYGDRLVNDVMSDIFTETLPSPASNIQNLSNGALRVSYSGFTPYQNIGGQGYGHNCISIWRTKAGGDVFYLDKTVSVSSVSGYVDTTTPDSLLGWQLDPDGLNGNTFYRGGNPFYFNGYGVDQDLEIAYNEWWKNESGPQIYGHTSADRVTAYIHDNFGWENHRRGFSMGGGDSTSDSGYAPYNFVTAAYIYNNIFVNNGGGCMKFNDYLQTTGDGGYWYLYNNVCYHNSTAADPATEIHIANRTQGNGTNISMKNNVIVGSTGGSYFTHSGTTPGATFQGDHNLWYGQGNGPSWSTTGDLDNINPQFTNSNPLYFSDFQLQSGSPAINSGTAVSLVATDFILTSRPQGSTYDIGAYEYDEGTVSDTMAPGAPSGLSVR